MPPKAKKAPAGASGGAAAAPSAGGKRQRAADDDTTMATAAAAPSCLMDSLFAPVLASLVVVTGQRKDEPLGGAEVGSSPPPKKKAATEKSQQPPEEAQLSAAANSSSKLAAAIRGARANPHDPSNEAEAERLAMGLVFPFPVAAFLQQLEEAKTTSASDDPAVLPNGSAEEKEKTTTDDETKKIVGCTRKDTLCSRLPQGCVCPALDRLSPFASDSDFLQAEELAFLFNHHFFSTQNPNHASNVVSNAHATLQALNLPMCRVVDTISLCLSLFQAVINVRLAKMPLSPRIVRVMEALKLSRREQQALLYVQTVHCGSWLLGSLHAPLSPVTVSRYASMSPKEIMWFISNSREHVKQGVININDTRMKSALTDMTVSMAQETVAAFSGIDLDEDQLIKLEKTCLATVIGKEQGGGRPSGAGGASGGSPLTGGGASAQRNNKSMTASDDDGELAFDGFELASDDGDSSGDEDGEGGGKKQRRLAAAVAAGGAGGASPLALVPTSGGTPTTLDVAPLTAGAVAAAAAAAGGGSAAAAAAAMSKMQKPYESDIEYMNDAFRALATMIKIRNAEADTLDEDEGFFNPKNKVEATLRELKGRYRVAMASVKMRLEATVKANKFHPKIEQISQRLRLSDIERQILLMLVGNMISHEILVAINGRYVMRDGAREMTVGYLLFVLCENLQERVRCRKYFYQSGALLANGVISVSLGGSTQRNCFNADLMDYLVDIDRKIVDYVMGIETETAEMVPGSLLYSPSVAVSGVVLPQETKELVLNTIEHYDLFSKCKQRCGFAEGLGTTPSGLVFLFYGPSGTGKTMLANAVAHDLGKKLLLVNLLQFKSDAKGPDILRFVFREAKLNDAIIFFDECESFFESRESNPLVTAILAEFEKYDGMIVLATNRAQIIDEAMNRRISLMIEFKLPDHQMREQIWRAHLPTKLPLAEDVSVDSLALDYELSGGLIRNATLAAISKAVGREKVEAPTLRMDDLVHGAKLQLRGFFQAAEKPSTGSELYVSPKRSLAELVVDQETKTLLESIAKLTKSRNTLFSQWGFNEFECADQGAICLFSGPSGTGKSLAVEGIAYECGATIRQCNVSELLLMNTLDVAGIFEEARKLGAVVVFDEAQVLFDFSERSEKLAQLIQYHAVRFPRPVIISATTGHGTSETMDSRSTKLQFAFEVSFKLPNRSLRRALWKKCLPEKVPKDGSVDFEVLSEDILSAKLIRTICFNACCRIALLPHAERRLKLQHLKDEKEDIMLRERRRNAHSSMFA